MTVGFILPALRRNLPTDLTVRADRATLSDAAVEFAAADKALLKTASDPAFFTLAGKTVSIWVKLDDSDDRLIFKQDENTLRYDPNEDAFIWDYNGFEDSYQTADGTDLTDWVHIVIVARSAGVKIYLNGILDTNDDSEIPVTGGDGNLYQFGGQLNGVWFDGKFDSSAIWEREFTDAEVLQLYNDGDGFTYSQLPANLATGIMHAWDFSARSSTGVWFDAVGGENLTEEFGNSTIGAAANSTSGATEYANFVAVGTDSFSADYTASQDHRAGWEIPTLNVGRSIIIRGKINTGGQNVRIRLGVGATFAVAASASSDINTASLQVFEVNLVNNHTATLDRAVVRVSSPSASGSIIVEDFEVLQTSIPLTTGITAGLAKAYGTDVGDSVSLWLDRSSEGNDLAQTSIVSQPILVEVDGRKGLRFDGVDDFISRAAMPELSIDQNFTVVMVVQTGARITGDQVYLANFVNTSDRLTIALRDSEWRVGIFDGTWTSRNAVVAVNTKYIITVTLDGASLSARLNGSTFNTTTAALPASTVSGLYIGNRSIAISAMDGIFHELIITNRAISTTERQRIERSLAAKYGITLA
jgi:hypothetical protein